MNLLKIKILLNEKQKSILWLSKEIGMSNQNLYKCFEKNRIEASDLEKIAKALNIKIGYFFDEAEDINTSEKGQEKEKADLSIEQLKDELIASYRTTIESQQKHIDMLEKELAFFKTEAQYKNKQAG